jgi:site-specific DNA-methyltransferase (adenine-specific)
MTRTVQEMNNNPTTPVDPTASKVTAEILVGDALTQLRTLQPGSVHAVITDPPYGLTAATDAVDLLDCWLTGRAFLGAGSGYAGNPWDHSVPGPELWTEVVRVLAPGGFVLAFAAARTIDLTGLALRLGGLDVRDSLHWTYATGVLRTPDLGKREQLFSGDAVAVARLSGQRATLRPAHEPILVARSPLLEDNLTDNVLACGTGAIRHGSDILTNCVVTHELDCYPSACTPGCPLDATNHGPEVTHLYPGQHIGLPSLRVAKPGTAERPVTANGTRHDTVKPLALMRWLIRAFTPEHGTVLDPFLGSGTTAEAAITEGRNVIGCEITDDYLPLIKQRLRRTGIDKSRIRGLQGVA